MLNYRFSLSLSTLKVSLFLWISVFINSHSFSQSIQSDKELLENTFFKNSLYEKGELSYLFSSSKPLVKYNPVSLILGGAMYFYQSCITHQLATDCPYSPSCSGFSAGAIREFGLFKGVLLSADRLLRCNNLSLYDLNNLPYLRKISDSPSHYHFTH